MNILTEDFHGKVLRYAVVTENGILFNTIDVCRILGVLERSPGSIFSESCMNMAGVIEAALTGGRNEMSFVEWLEAKFIGYDMLTSTAFDCDGDWNIKS